MSAPGQATRSTASQDRRRRGFSYIEVLLATVLIALALVPALEAVSTGLRGASIEEALTLEYHHVASRIAELAGEPFDSLDAEAQVVADETLPTSYSDAPGTPMRRLVYLARYDGDGVPPDLNPFVGGDDGLLWIRVEVENSEHGFATLRAR